MQPEFEQPDPGQLLPQYEATLRHQALNWRHFKDSGKSAVKKHVANWIKQLPAATLQLFLSMIGGRGFEHHFPTLYSQTGAGVLVVYDVHRLEVLVVVVTTFDGRVVVVDTALVVL